MAEGIKKEPLSPRERWTLAGIVLAGVVIAILAVGFVVYHAVIAAYLTYQLMAMAVAAEPFKFWLFKVGLAAVVAIITCFWLTYRITKAWNSEEKRHSSDATTDDRASYEYDEGSGDSGAVEPAWL